MFLTTSPQALPGSCYKCGSGSRERYVDLDISVEFHGAMYLCDICIAEMARLMGMATAEDLRGLTDKIEHLESELFTAMTRAAGLERAHNGLVDAGYCPDPVAHLHPDNHPRSEDLRDGDGEADGGGAGGVQTGEASVAGGEGTPAEPLHDEGVAVVHSDVSSDGGFNLDL